MRGEDGIVVLQPRNDDWIDALLLGHDVFGRQAVGFGEEHVEGHYRSAKLVQAGGQFCNQRARPGPLAEVLEGAFVNINDADGCGL